MNDKKQEREKYLYHNTELLLKKYREVVWSIEASAIRAEMNFEIETGCKMSEFLDMSYAAGFDLAGCDIAEQARTMERNKKMLAIVDAAVDLMRRKHENGEEYYWVIYYSYLSDKPLKSVDDIIDKVEKYTGPISCQTLYNWRKDATATLSSILWGYTTKDCLGIIESMK